MTIPLFFGSDPQLDLLDENVEIILNPLSIGGMGPSPPDPIYRRLSPFRAEVYYSEAPLSIGGVFTLSVISGSMRADVTDINIIVNRE